MEKILLAFNDESSGMGDIISLLPYAEKFREYNNCDLYMLVKPSIPSSIFSKSYPHIKFLSDRSEDLSSFKKKVYLKYQDLTVPLQENFARQLGFQEWEYLRPKVDSYKKERPIKNKYVAIGVHATAQLKYWNHPSGKKSQPDAINWNDLCGMIRKSGYTPVVLELYENYGYNKDNFKNGIPPKANKKIGMPIEEVLNYIEHSEFFIGLSSGLSWLAHAAGKPVCIISNFTEEWNEFDLSLPDYKRITNKSVCHGCWNKINVDFSLDYEDWYWCPRHKGTNRQFECHTSITPQRVFDEIKEWLK